MFLPRKINEFQKIKVKCIVRFLYTEKKIFNVIHVKPYSKLPDAIVLICCC